ncbi:MAG: carboxypeptidase-like regulatory domain-containing protein, partial [Olleya sp.]
MSLKNHKSAVLLLFLIANIFSNYAQNIKGKIVSDTSEPVPFATIQIGADYGVISNDEGNFSISTAGFQPSDSVTISCLGYEKIGLKLEEFTSQDFVLK